MGAIAKSLNEAQWIAVEELKRVMGISSNSDLIELALDELSRKWTGNPFPETNPHGGDRKSMEARCAKLLFILEQKYTEPDGTAIWMRNPDEEPDVIEYAERQGWIEVNGHGSVRITGTGEIWSYHYG